MALERRKVTMRSVTLAPDGTILNLEATDYIDISHVDDYAADARTRWQYVEIGSEPDDGPGGPDGEYIPPAILNGD